MRLTVHENKKVWFTSDPHFNHANIINLCHRPYDNVEHMNRNLIENWNNVVGKDDYIFCLGDFSYKGSGTKVSKIIEDLNGVKFFIQGNHEADLMNSRYRDHVSQRIELLYREKMLILDHYPMISWNQSHRGSIQLFGHEHGNLQGNHKPNQLDVGVDCHNYTPISFERVEEIVSLQIEKCKLVENVV